MTRRHCVSVTRASAASVAACVALLCVPTLSVAAAPSDSHPEADRGSAPLARGSGYGQPQAELRVRALQRKLRALGHRPGPVDGLYGPQTEAAVERLQRDSGLSIDGIVGPQTRRVLDTDTPPLAPGAGYGHSGGSTQVREVQRRLRALGQRPGPVDGRYGPRTRAAIERFQRKAGQPASGVLSPATATALWRADRGQPGRRPASRTAVDADDRPGGADGSGPAGGSDRSDPAARDRSAETDGAVSMSPVLWVALVLTLGTICGLLAGWLMRRRRSPEPSGVAGRPVGPWPMSNRVMEAAKQTGVEALGYVSAREPEAVDGPELRDQVAAIHTACCERGLALEEVITDVVPVKHTSPERPGLQNALQRLAAGEASCLVVAELGRLSRSAPEVGYIVEWLRRRDARLVAVDDGLDTATGTGRERTDRLVSPRAFDGRQRLSGRTGYVPERRRMETANGGGSPARPRR
jgi:peptidoglycan hydrolase-like protein with peptidoglycan-binding domain